MTETQVRGGPRNRLDVRSLRLAAGPPLPAVNLDAWLEPKEEPIWRIPVPADFELRGRRLVGSSELAAGFDPRTVPWLASSFADLASASPTAVRDFATRFGVTGPWLETEAGVPDVPRERDVDDMTAEAKEIRDALRSCRYLQSFRDGSTLRIQVEDRAATVAVERLRGFVDKALGSMPRGAAFGLDARPGEAVGSALTISPGGSFWPPPDLLDLIRLQVLADWTAGRQVRECAFRSAKGEPCGKLFIWPENSEKSRLKGWGHPPAYCSPRHAKAAAQQRRRAKQKRG